MTLTRFSPMFHFSTPGKPQKVRGFLNFSKGIEMDHWCENRLKKTEEGIVMY